MANDTGDERVLHKIHELVAEEHALRDSGELDDTQRARLKVVEVELDQCWDLLRQRRALREFGGDPNQAKVRPPNIVEKYEQ